MRKSVMFLLWMIAIVIVLILFVGGGLIVESLQLTQQDGAERLRTSGSAINSEQGGDNSIPFCGNEVMLLTNSPIEANDLVYVTPLGWVDPPANVFASDTLLFNLVRHASNESYAAEAQVFSPGHVWITKIVRHTIDGEATYALSMQPCAEVTFVISDMTFVLRSILQEDATFSDCTTYHNGEGLHEVCSLDTFIEVTPGTEIGRGGGFGNPTYMGVNVYDTRFSPYTFANPFRFDFSKTGQPACPLHYFTTQTKEVLETYVGTYDNEEIIQQEADICGQAFFDVERTFLGSWFLKGSATQEDESMHLALIQDYLDEDVFIFSIGTSIPNLDAGTYTFRASRTEKKETEGYTNIGFNETTVGNMYCFDVAETHNYVIFAELVSQHELMIETLRARECDGLSHEFSEEAVTFIR